MAVLVIEIKETLNTVAIVLHSYLETSIDTDKEKETARNIKEALDKWFHGIQEEPKKESENGDLAQTEQTTP